MVEQIKRKREMKKRHKNMIFVACLVAFPLLQYFVFYLMVNFNSLLLAFQSYDPGVGSGNGKYFFIGFDNFVKLYNEFTSEGLILICIKNSVVAYALNLCIGTTFGLIFSYYIAKKRFASKVFKVMLFLPSIISSIVLITVFKYFADYMIPNFMNNFFGTKIDALISTKSTAFGSIIFYNIWTGFGTAILLYSGAMSNVSESIIEAAKIDGAGVVTEFLRIVFPMIFPTFRTMIISGFTGIFTNNLGLFSFFGTSAERYLWTFGYYILRGTRLATLADYPYLASIGVVLTVFCVPLTFTIRRLLNKFGPSVD